MTLARQFGDVGYYRVGPLRVYQLNHPDLARQILVEQPEKFLKARLIKRAFRPFAGNGLLTSDGALWRQQRKLIQPAFHRRRGPREVRYMGLGGLEVEMRSNAPGCSRELSALAPGIAGTPG